MLFILSQATFCLRVTHSSEVAFSGKYILHNVYTNLNMNCAPLTEINSRGDP